MSTFGHLAVGAAVGRLTGPADRRVRWWMLWLAAVGIAADLDFIGVWLFGVGPGSTWNHRGASHSMVLALVGGMASMVVAWPLALDRRLAFLAGTFVAATHPLIDGFGWYSGGLPLWWPFSQDFFQAPFQFLPGVVMTADYLRFPGLGWLALELVGSVLVVGLAGLVRDRRGTAQKKPPADRNPPVVSTGEGTVSSRPR